MRRHIVEKTIFNPLDFSNKKIMITGASSGIGRATAIYLSKLGAQLVLIGRNEERLKETLSNLENNKQHILIQEDIAEAQSMADIFEVAVKDGIKLNGLVHSAGIAQVIPLNMLTAERIYKEMNINYIVYIELIRLYAKKKYSDNGSIVGISSIASTQPEQCQTNYSASKAAVDVSSQALAIELAKKNIRINTVLPGVIATEMVLNANESGVDLNSIKKRQLLGEGTPEDVAATVTFLLSDMSRFITGRKIFVDGGRFI